MIRSRSFVAAAAVALVAAASAAMAAPTDWSNPNGSTSAFDYSQGRNANGLYGSPTVTSDGFFFAPAGLVAQADSGKVSDSKSDTLSVILNAKANSQFSRIGGNLFGDFAAFPNSRAGLASTNTGATLRVTNLDTSISLSSPLSFDPTFPQTAATGVKSGPFTGLSSIALPAGWRNVKVELDDSVSADALAGSAFIQTKGADVAVETTNIPIPAAAVALPMLGAAAYKLRRKIVR